jgi:hypothetical protein
MVFSEIDAVVSGTSLSGDVLAGAGCCRLASSCDEVVSAGRSGLDATSSEAMVLPEMLFPEINAVVSGESLSDSVLAGAGCCRPASSCDGVVSVERSGLAGTLSESMVLPEMSFTEIDPVASGESSCSEALESRSNSVLLPLDVLRGG